LQFHITKLLENKVPKIGVASATEEARLQESEKFRKYAAECIRIASQMSGKDRQALLEIADAWETRAQDAEKKGKGSPPLTNLYPAPPSAAAGLPSHRALTSMRVREV
jgi:hypothetical protein